MDKQQRKIIKLEAIVKRGRWKHALVVSLTLMVAPIIMQVQKGNSFEVVALSIGIVSLITFVFSYSRWPSHVKKLERLTAESKYVQERQFGEDTNNNYFDEGTEYLYEEQPTYIAEPTPRKYWAKPVILILVVLGVAGGAYYYNAGGISRKVYVDKRPINITINLKDRGLLKYRFSTAYLITESGKVARNLQKVNDVDVMSIRANVLDMQPMPDTTERYTIEERHLQNPSKNPNAITIVTIPATMGAGDGAGKKHVHGNIKRELKVVEGGQKTTAYGLEFQHVLADIKKFQSSLQKMFTSKSAEQNFIFGTDSDNASILCDDSACVLLSYENTFGAVFVEFNRQYLPYWRRLRQNSINLMRGFIVANVESNQ